MGNGIKALIIVICILSMCAVLQAFQAAAEETEEQKFLLGPGDRIVVRIPIEPALSGEYTIDERGKFYLPILDEGLDLGAFNVQGMTTVQVALMVKERIDQYYADSEVTVELVSRGVRPGEAVSVFGLIGSAGTYRYFEGMRMLDLLIKCGGLSDSANVRRVALYRKEDPVRYIDLTGLLDGTDLSNNIEVQAGDYIIVPRQEPAMKMKVIVLGKVGSPGTVYVPEGTQILDLIGHVGGTVGRAALGRTYIIRVVDGKPVIIESDLKALITRVDLKQNVAIKDGDIVFVPETSRIDINQIINDLMRLELIRTIIEPKE